MSSTVSMCQNEFLYGAAVLIRADRDFGQRYNQNHMCMYIYIYTYITYLYLPYYISYFDYVVRYNHLTSPSKAL